MDNFNNLNGPLIILINILVKYVLLSWREQTGILTIGWDEGNVRRWHSAGLLLIFWGIKVLTSPYFIVSWKVSKGYLRWCFTSFPSWYVWTSWGGDILLGSCSCCPLSHEASEPAGLFLLLNTESVVSWLIPCPSMYIVIAEFNWLLSRMNKI